MNHEFAPSVTAENLRQYYESVWPCNELIQWFTYGGTVTFQTRDMAFSILDKERDSNYVLRPVHMKFQKGAFKSVVTEKNPYRIDIGGNFCIPAQKRFVSAIPGGIPIEHREIVFDIDMDPPVNWEMIKEFIKVLDYDLRHCFGFEHILFIFSGKKGIHCWVCDQSARWYGAAGRSNLAQYFKEKIPYLDYEVTEQITHMTKMPFSVHPATGKLCVPIDISHLDMFDPEKIPTLESSLDKIRPYIRYFTDSFLRNLLAHQ